MASYTDQPVQFNPYISRLPLIQEISGVTQEKQAKYDQGVQKIQTYIDNIAGMDITDKHKPYLQSKLNELGNKLKTVAAGDFSNQQLVNSVGGMATSVIKDPIVQTGVSSAQRIKQVHTDMEAATKAGKSSPSNDYVAQLSISDWLNNGDLKNVYSGKYEQAVDTTKPLLEEMKAAHVEKEAHNEGIITGYDKDGKAIINQDLIRHYVTEGLPKSKAAAIAKEVYSRPDIARQLEIDATYNYRGYDKTNLLTNRLDAINYQKEEIFAQNPSLRNYATLGNSNIQSKANQDLQDNINKLNSLDKDYFEFAGLANKNLEAAKHEAYLQNKIGMAVRTFGGVNIIDDDIKKNPQTEINLDREKIQLTKNMNSWQIENIKSEIEHRKFEDKIALAKLEGKIDADGNKIWKVGDPEAINPEVAKKFGSGTFYDNIKATDERKNQIFANIISATGVDLGDGKGSRFDLYVPSGSKDGGWKLNPKYLNTDPKGPILNDEGSKLYNAAKDQMSRKVNDVINLHLTGGANANYADEIKQWYDLSTVSSAKKKAAQNVETEFAPILNKIASDAKVNDSYTIDIHIPKKPGFFTKGTDTKVTLSKNDLVDMALYSKGVTKVGGIPVTMTDGSKQAEARLTAKFGDMTGNIIATVGQRFNTPASGAYLNVLSELDKSNNVAFLNKREDKFKDLQRQASGNVLTFSTKDEKLRDQLRLDLISEIGEQRGSKTGSGILKDASLALEKVKSGEPDNTVYSFRYDDTKGKWFANISKLSNGNFVGGGEEIEVSKGFAQKHNLESQLDPQETAFSQSIGGQLLNLHDGHSTTSDVHSPDAYVDAIERSNVGHYSIGHHLVSKDGNNTLYFPKLYIRDNETGKTYNAVDLDWYKLKDLPNLSKSERQYLHDKPSYYDRKNITTAVENFKSTMAKQPNPNLAIEALLKDYK